MARGCRCKINVLQVPGRTTVTIAVNNGKQNYKVMLSFSCRKEEALVSMHMYQESLFQ